MKRIVLITMFLFLFTSFISLNAQWARTYGGDDDELATSIQQTYDGGYIVSGWTVSFGAGAIDYWILKLNPAGGVEWQKTYGGSDRDIGGSIQQTSDGGFIVRCGTVSFATGLYDRWILKLDSEGNTEWQKTYGGFRYEIEGTIQQTDDGGYVFACISDSFSSGDRDFWVVKLDSLGVIQWQKSYGGISRELNPVWIQQTAGGGFIVAVTTSSYGTGDYDMWILKLDSVGEIEWQRTYGGSGYELAWCIQQTDDGGYVATCGTKSFGAGDFDYWVLKLSSKGEIEWQKIYGGSDCDMPHLIQQTYDGGYVIAGGTMSYGAGDYDMWILKLDSVGEIEWQRTYGGVEQEWATSIQQTEEGGYIVAGFTDSFGAGRADVWILKLDSNGDMDPSCGFIGSSNASVSDTNVNPIDTYSLPQDTYTSPHDTYVIPQVSNAAMSLICSAPPHLGVQIDIKPGSFPNSINLGSQGNVPVAIFSVQDFDATTVDPTTVTLAGASVRLKGKGTPMASFEDVNGDSLLDIIVHVDTTALKLSEGDTEALLEGTTNDGQKIRGKDTVRIVNE